LGVRTEAAVRSARVLAARTGLSEGEIIAGVEAAQPLGGGLMEPEDIAGAYLFLLRPTSPARRSGSTAERCRGEGGGGDACVLRRLRFACGRMPLRERRSR
jgi:hypothetical protein